MVFQSYALFPHMSVFENVAFGLRAQERAQGPDHPPGRRDAGDRRPDRAREAPAPGAVRRPAAARRAGPGAGQPPAALLLDEPLGALDLKLRQAMQVELKRIQREVGITFVYVTHDQNEALTMSDRIAVMNDGVIEHLGPPREIYEHPATRFVAGFIGTSNLLTGSLARVTGGQGVIEVEPGRADRRPGPGSVRAGRRRRARAHRPAGEDRARAPGRARPAAARCAAPSPRSSTSAPRPTSRSPPPPGRTSSSSSRTQPRRPPRSAGVTTSG